jgi:DNA-binding response OmpR family regulator
VTLRSVPGRGSCFTLELPAATPVEPAAAAPLPRGSAPLAGVAVWLIEDDDAQREAMGERLRRWGAQVTALAGQADLRRRLDAPPGERTPAPALVLSDQRLGDGNGVDCVALIRAHIGRAVPAVIVTGETAPAAMALLAACGLPVLHKPFSADELLDLLHTALRGRRGEEEGSGDDDPAHCAAVS